MNTEANTNETAAAEQGATVAPEITASKKDVTKKGAPKHQKGGAAQPTTPFDGPEPAGKAKAAKVATKSKAAKKAVKAKKAPNRESKAKATRQGSNKKAEVITMLRRAKGATLSEIMEATAWAPHTVRGFISLLGSKHGMKIESSRRESDKARVYVAEK